MFIKDLNTGITNLKYVARISVERNDYHDDLWDVLAFIPGHSQTKILVQTELPFEEAVNLLDGIFDRMTQEGLTFDTGVDDAPPDLPKPNSTTDEPKATFHQDDASQAEQTNSD